MRHAMDGAESPDEIAAIDGNHRAGRKGFGEDIERYGIVGVAEDGGEYKSIRNIEICVAGGEALAPVNDRPRHWELDHFQTFSVLIGRRF